MKKAFKAAAAMFLIACGDVAPPEAAENITEAQREIIEADLDRLEVQSDFVKELMDRADPLPDINSGKKMEDNEHIKELIDSGLVDGRWYLENDHFLIANPDEINKDLDELAPGMRTQDDITDNYIVILHDEADGELTSRDTGTYMHEFSRFYYPVDHLLVGEEMLLKSDPIVGEIMSKIYGIDQAGEDFFDPLSKAERRLDSLKSIKEKLDAGTLEEEWAEYLNGEDFEEKLEATVKYYHEEIDEFSDMSEMELIEYNINLNIVEIQENIAGLDGFGITRDEYIDALQATPELFEPAGPERVEGMLFEVEEMFPEYNFEITEGMQAETRAEQDKERTFEVHRESSRR